MTTSIRHESPQAAWDALVRGNNRFVTGAPAHPRQDIERREALAAKQKPFAAVFGCADSRLSAEIIFDVGLGDLFVVRNAGQVIGLWRITSHFQRNWPDRHQPTRISRMAILTRAMEVGTPSNSATAPHFAVWSMVDWNRGSSVRGGFIEEEKRCRALRPDTPNRGRPVGARQSPAKAFCSS